jgi:hypothetical protein
MFAQEAKVSYFRDASPGGDGMIAIADVVNCRVRLHDAPTRRRKAGTLDTGGDIHDDGEGADHKGGNMNTRELKTFDARCGLTLAGVADEEWSVCRSCVSRREAS